MKKTTEPRYSSDSNVLRDLDAAWCPEMMVLPAGEFGQGSPETDQEARDREKPPHRVVLRYRFAIGRHPVTVGEYQRFIEATGYSHSGGLWIRDSLTWKEDLSKSWRDPGFQQTDRHPVVGVSWRDAQGYIEWLKRETGKPYRLPTESEWEYACRAGTTTRYAVGDTITPKDANYAGNVNMTTEVGSYPPNPWGLFDMHGNVWEWMEDTWHDSYEGAPTNGLAWTDGEGEEFSMARVLRGGSWGLTPRSLRSSNRGRNLPNLRDYYFGFRVALSLDRNEHL